MHGIPFICYRDNIITAGRYHKTIQVIQPTLPNFEKSQTMNIEFTTLRRIVDSTMATAKTVHSAHYDSYCHLCQTTEQPIPLIPDKGKLFIYFS